MLETQLAEVKHQGELKFQHPEHKPSPHHDTLKEQEGYHLLTGPPVL
jgi:hypothetical protein